jgi:cobalt-zinc-cadmium efflux system protein
MLEHGEKTLNTRAALLHVMGDLLGSLAAPSRRGDYFTGWMPIDPIRQVAAHPVFPPGGCSRGAARAAGRRARQHRADVVQGDGVEGVRTVHDRTWTLSQRVALSAHLASSRALAGNSASRPASAAKRFGIEHVTLQPGTGAAPTLEIPDTRPAHHHEEKKAEPVQPEPTVLSISPTARRIRQPREDALAKSLQDQIAGFCARGRRKPCQGAGSPLCRNGRL